MTNLPTGPSAPLSFSFDQSFNVRVVMRDGDPWFYAADVCAAIGLANTTKALKSLDDDEKMQVVDPDTLNSIQGTSVNNLVNVINESGLYSLVMTSRKPEAKRFKKWVTSEVLPSIRKTGTYQMPQPAAPFVQETISSAELHKLSQIVYLIRNSFHAKEAASWAAYAGLRKQFGLEKGIASLPASHFDQAVQVLTEMEKLAFRLKGIVLEVERRFFRQVLRAGKPLDEDAFNAVFDTELQQMLEHHRDALKFLN